MVSHCRACMASNVTGAGPPSRARNRAARSGGEQKKTTGTGVGPGRSLAEIASRGWDDVAVVSHGAAIRSWASARVRGADLGMIERTTLANTGLVAIEGDPDSGWHLVDWSSRPLGGAHLTMPVPDDPTGDAVEA